MSAPRRSVALVFVCALLGANLSAISALAGGQSYRASALLDIGGQLPSDASVDQLNRVVQTELLTLNSEALQSAVGERLGGVLRPDVEATQVGNTTVAQVTAVADTVDTAVEAANATAAAYTDRELARAADASRGQRERIDARIAELSDRLDGTLSAAGDATVSRDAVQAEIARLQALSLQLESDAAQVGAGSRLVQPATPDTVSPTRSAPRASALGGLLGTILGLGLALALGTRLSGGAPRRSAG